MTNDEKTLVVRSDNADHKENLLLEAEGHVVDEVRMIIALAQDLAKQKGVKKMFDGGTPTDEQFGAMVSKLLQIRDRAGYAVDAISEVRHKLNKAK